jgi:hypothetical protein
VLVLECDDLINIAPFGRFENADMLGSACKCGIEVLQVGGSIDVCVPRLPNRSDELRMSS